MAVSSVSEARKQVMATAFRIACQAPLKLTKHSTYARSSEIEALREALDAMGVDWRAFKEEHYP